MSTLDYKQFSERHRPHIHPPGATLFVTYRLAGSIPQPVVRKYRAKKEWFETELKRATKITKDRNTPEVQEWLERAQRFHRVWFLKFEDVLHQAKIGPMWMKDRRVAEKASESLRRLDGQSYTLDSYCVMSNHVHAVFTPFLADAGLKESFDEFGRLIFISDSPGLAQIMHSLKGRTARECNLILSRTGQFWEHESFDHVVRPGKLKATLKYVLNNPVKAGLVSDWRQWRWNYCRSGLLELL